MSGMVLNELIARGLPPSQVNIGVRQIGRIDSSEFIHYQRAAATPESVDNIVKVAKHHSIPLREISAICNMGLDRQVLPGTVHLLVCYPHKLPVHRLDFANNLYLNLHPSLLPENRGPEPVFWQLKRGSKTIGLTLHQVSPTYDAGHIVRQSRITVADFPNRPEINQRISKAGVKHVVSVVQSMNTNSFPMLEAQNDLNASYQSWPQLSDYELDENQHVERVFRFVNGVWSPNIVFKLKSSPDHEPVGQPLMWLNTDSDVNTTKNTRAKHKIYFKGGWIQFAAAV